LQVGDTTYTRTLKKAGDSVQLGGDPVLSDTTATDNFAILLRSNPARQAVIQQRGLRDIVMEPVEIDHFQSKIDDLREERDTLDEKLEQINQYKQELPSVEQDITSVETEMEELNEEKRAVEERLATIEEEIAASSDDADNNEKIESLQSDANSLLDDIEDLQDKKNEKETTINSLENTIGRLKEELDQHRDTIATHEDVSKARKDQLNEKVNALSQKRTTLQNRRSKLMTVIETNREILQEGALGIVDQANDDGTAETGGALYADLEEESSDDHPDEFTCPTCGQATTKERFENVIGDLKSAETRLTNQIEEVGSKRDEVLSEKSEIEDALKARRTARRQLEEKESKLERVQADLERTRERVDEIGSEIATLESKREEIREEIVRLEQKQDEQEEGKQQERLDLRGEVSRINEKINTKQTELSNLTEKKQTLSEQIEDVSSYEERKQAIREDITDVQNTISNLEDETIERFNEEFEEILEVLEYDNIERIRLKAVRRGEPSTLREEAETGEFRMKIARVGEDGAYEDDYSNLSESEQEVTGLLFALAGYLAHDVYEELPFMLLDSVEAVDPERIAALVEHFEQYCDYLVVALLEDDAEVLSDDYTYVDSFAGSATPVTS